MRVSELIDLGQEYLILGGIVAFALIMIFWVGYFLIYKKIIKGEKRIQIATVGKWAVLLCYITIVVGATLLGRGDFQNWGMKPLFYSYRDAWYNFSVVAWRNIILNILMFVPLGFLLPWAIRFFRKFWKTYLAGFGFSLFIEVIQLVSGRGMFEADDILDNTMGALIGYGIYAVVAILIATVGKQRGERKVRAVVALQIPLVVTLIAFSVIFIIYDVQDLGNNPDTYLAKCNVQVTSDISFDKNETAAKVYELPNLSQAQAEEFAKKFFENLGTRLDPAQNDFYDETGFFRSENDFSLSVDYRGGAYQFIDFDYDMQPEGKRVGDADEDEVRKALKTYGVEIPKEATCEVDENKQYKYTVNLIEDGETMMDGVLTCSYYGNGKIGSINNYIHQGKLHGTYDIISEQEAYEQLCQGKFKNFFTDTRDIRVKRCERSYVIDTKGYYQPNYVFFCEIDGETIEIHIPAIKK